MRPQHLLASAIVVASQTPCLPIACAFSPSSSSSIPSSMSSSVVGRRSRTVGGSGGSSRNSRLRWTNDEEALTELEALIHDLKKVGPSISSPSSPGRSPPSTSSMIDASSAHGMPWTDTIGRSDAVDPLLYMPFWEWQLNYMKSSLTNLHPIECTASTSTTTSRKDVSYNENREKRARIVNHCYASDEYRKIRMTYYDAGDSVQVFNSVWYPDAKYNLPVLGIDLLSFNRKRYLAIVDFQPLHENEDGHASKYEHVLRPIKDGYENLKGKMSSKFYDETQFFSREMLFARFEDGDIVTKDLFPAFRSYVEAHVDLVDGTVPDIDPISMEVVLERQRAYDTYSAERDPAAGLFASMFGKDWAEDFIYDFLFSMSERREGGLNLSPPTFGGGGGPPPPAAAHGPPPPVVVHHVAPSQSTTHIAQRDASEMIVVVPRL